MGLKGVSTHSQSIAKMQNCYLATGAGLVTTPYFSTIRVCGSAPDPTRDTKYARIPSPVKSPVVSTPLPNLQHNLDGLLCRPFQLCIVQQYLPPLGRLYHAISHSMAQTKRTACSKHSLPLIHIVRKCK